MGQDLTGKPPKTTYRWLLHIGTHLLGALRRVSLGNGTDSALSISETAAKIHGNLDVTGSIINADLVKISALTNDLITGGTTTAPTAEQVKILKGLIDQINTVLISDDVNLDELQELVTYIKSNRGDIDSLGIAGVAGLQAALDAITSKIWVDVPDNTKTEAHAPSSYQNDAVSVCLVAANDWTDLTGSAQGKVTTDRRNGQTLQWLVCHSPQIYRFRYAVANTWQGWVNFDSSANFTNVNGYTHGAIPSSFLTGKIHYARVSGAGAFLINGVLKSGYVETKNVFWKGQNHVIQIFQNSDEKWERLSNGNSLWLGWRRVYFHNESFHSSSSVTHIDQLTSNLQSSVNMAMLKSHLATQLPTYTDDAAADADAALPSGSRYKLTGSRAIYQKP